MSKKTPLETTFNIGTVKGETILEDDKFKVELPKNPTLDDVIKFALQAYADHMGDIQHIEPKFRARNLEVTQLFLNIAKDALHKKEEIKLKNATLELKKGDPGKAPAGDSYDRKTILREIKKASKKVNES